MTAESPDAEASRDGSDAFDRAARSEFRPREIEREQLETALERLESSDGEATERQRVAVATLARRLTDALAPAAAEVVAARADEEGGEPDGDRRFDGPSRESDDGGSTSVSRSARASALPPR